MCIGVDPAIFYPEESHMAVESIYNAGKRYCAACPVRIQCLNDALEWEIEQWRRFGLWGGMTPRERQAESERRWSIGRR